MLSGLSSLAPRPPLPREEEQKAESNHTGDLQEFWLDEVKSIRHILTKDFTSKVSRQIIQKSVFKRHHPKKKEWRGIAWREAPIFQGKIYTQVRQDPNHFSGCNLFLKIGPVENLDILSLLMFHVSKTGNQVWPTVLYVSLDRTVMQRTGGNCPAHDESYKACGGGNTWAGITLCWWNTREAGCSFKAKISSSKYTFSLDGVKNEISNAVISTAMQTEEAIKANA